MKLVIDSMITGGVESPGAKGIHAEYTVLDAESGAEFAVFTSLKEAEGWLAANRARLESAPLPPMSERELRMARLDIERMEAESDIGLLGVYLARWEKARDGRIQDERLRTRLNTLRARLAAGAGKAD
jgi:hypothetical protein